MSSGGQNRGWPGSATSRNTRRDHQRHNKRTTYDQTVFNLSTEPSWTAVNVLAADDIGYRGLYPVENHLDGVDERGVWQVIRSPTEDVVGTIVRDTTDFSDIDTRRFRRKFRSKLVQEFGQTDVLRFSKDGKAIEVQRLTYLSEDKAVEGESWTGARVTDDSSGLDVWLAHVPDGETKINPREADPLLRTIYEDTGIKAHWWDNDAGDITVGHYPNAIDREIIDI